MFTKLTKIKCSGCGVSFEKKDVPSNRYGVASSECWNRFLELQAWERQNFGYPDVHRLVVDAYHVQHPPRLELQQELQVWERLIQASAQSFWVHLYALYLAIEKKVM